MRPLTLTFDLGLWTYMAGQVVNPCTKVQDPTAILCCVLTSLIDIAFAATVHAPYHVTYALGKIFPTYLKSLTMICLLNVKFVLRPRKGISLRITTSFGVFCVNVRGGFLQAGDG